MSVFNIACNTQIYAGLTPVIIHDPAHVEREKKLKIQLNSVGVTEWVYSPAIYEKPVEKGIYLAHLQAMERSLSLDGIVMEDDISFTSPRSLEYWKEQAKDLPSDWHFYLMGYYNHKLGERVTERLDRLKWFTGMQGYMVSEAGYERLLRVGVKKHIDVGLAGFSVYCCSPVVAMQDLSIPSVRLGRCITNYDSIIKKVKTLRD